MHRIFLILASLVVIALSACAAPGGSAPTAAQVQQVVTTFCPTVNADLQVLSTSPAVSPQLQAQFKTMLSVNQQICSAGTGVTIADLQTLNTQVVQAAIAVLLLNPEIPNQPAILLALQLGAPLVQQAITQLQAGQPKAGS
jgi:hypothetical protein